MIYGSANSSWARRSVLTVAQTVILTIACRLPGFSLLDTHPAEKRADEFVASKARIKRVVPSIY